MMISLIRNLHASRKVLIMLPCLDLDMEGSTFKHSFVVVGRDGRTVLRLPFSAKYPRLWRFLEVLRLDNTTVGSDSECVAD